MSTQNDLMPRPPVVVVMGHIDHGKSTLLDYIRKANTTAKEEGGITQHISAYEAECEVSGEKKRITFLDTPGHEAFSTIRERGSRVADIAVLVVSAEDGVKPQTLEALNWITKNNVPFIVAMNKIDKPGANIDKTKQSLAENNVFVEGWGGNVPWGAISAKTGEGIPELLELISLQADLLELKGDPKILAEGFVIESELNPRQGITATLVVKNGTLKIGMFVATEGSYSSVRLIEDFKRSGLKEATFSNPIRVIGWSDSPKAGNQFKTFLTKDEAVLYAESEKIKAQKVESENGNAEAFLPIVIKADTFGSLEALEHEAKKLNTEKLAVKVISKGVGTISEKDIKTAAIKKSLILGFNVNIDKSAESLALRENIEVKTYNIIYELVDYLREKIKASTPVSTIETIIGSAKIIRVFSKNKDKQVIGGKVDEGEIRVGNLVKIYRRDALIGDGKIKEIQSQKIKTDSIKESQEFGMMIESKIELVPGDFLRATAMVRQE